MYGRGDPFAPAVTPIERERSFARTTLDGHSLYNAGTRGICCMVQPTNTLSALVKLVTVAAGCRIVVEGSGGRRSMTCAERSPCSRAPRRMAAPATRSSSSGLPGWRSSGG